mmetsp:Transcript_2519/g.5767  ORF Transcript_2519/g.5767 Transcript_2519/m.5767 type:complete len:253 (-) Transcript_2519:1-759(-)
MPLGSRREAHLAQGLKLLRLPPLPSRAAVPQTELTPRPHQMEQSPPPHSSQPAAAAAANRSQGLLPPFPPHCKACLKAHSPCSHLHLHLLQHRRLLAMARRRMRQIRKAAAARAMVAERVLGARSLRRRSPSSGGTSWASRKRQQGRSRVGTRRPLPESVALMMVAEKVGVRRHRQGRSSLGTRLLLPGVMMTVAKGAGLRSRSVRVKLPCVEALAAAVVEAARSRRTQGLQPRAPRQHQPRSSSSSNSSRG